MNTATHPTDDQHPGTTPEPGPALTCYVQNEHGMTLDSSASWESSDSLVRVWFLKGLVRVFSVDVERSQMPVMRDAVLSSELVDSAEITPIGVTRHRFTIDLPTDEEGGAS